MSKQPLFIRITKEAKTLLEAEKERSALSQSAIVDLSIKFFLSRPQASDSPQQANSDLTNRIAQFTSYGRPR